jgi:prepilin-type N-terminal cleavage/methylation domain-containing protein
MTARRGFTLIEVMVALIVSGLVVSLAYAAAQGGLDTEARLGTHRTHAESLVALRAMLTDALRHAERGRRGGPAVFALRDAVDSDGAPSDSLVFLTRGIESPLGTSGIWTLLLTRRADTLRLAATAGTDDRSADAGRAALLAEVPGVTGLDVRALGRTALTGWRGTWDDADVAPEAVSITLRGSDGGRAAPLVVRMGLERSP